MNLTIDASNIRRGGGATHLTEILTEADPERNEFASIAVWAPRRLLDRLPDRPWLSKCSHPAIEAGGVKAQWFRKRTLDRLIDPATDLLWAPGGMCLSRFRPYVTMVRNFLPFDIPERDRFRFSLTWLRYLYLRRAQSRSFVAAQGLIHISQKTHEVINRQLDLNGVRQTTIYHGLSPRFLQAPRPARPSETFTPENPARVLYVSQLTFYKHQDKLVEALARVRDKGIPVQLDLVGPTYPGFRPQMERALKAHDPDGEWVKHHGEVPYEQVADFLTQADLFTALSTCETFGMFMLEAMAAGLPVLASNRSALPEINGGTCPEVDPEDVDALAAALERMIRDKDLRQQTAEAAHRRAQTFSWSRCADETFGFLACGARAGRGSGSK